MRISFLSPAPLSRHTELQASSELPSYVILIKPFTEMGKGECALKKELHIYSAILHPS